MQFCLFVHGNIIIVGLETASQISHVAIFFALMDVVGFYAAEFLYCPVYVMSCHCGIVIVIITK